ncbi:hypothetical protein FBU31_000393 [Coemansia sp. 'formosensis']|nr:hypothetical protein FBU31_000393 [Coemansia sp. 'formosensis']
MPDINDLPEDVLEQILLKAAATPAKTLAKWKAKLPLLAVCRTWTKLAIGAVFNQVYVELLYSPDNSYMWTSNANLYISRGCVLMAQSLVIEWEDEATIDHLRFIVLDVLKLDRVDWQLINTLTIARRAQTHCRSVQSFSHYEPLVTNVARILQYFRQNLRNIVELDISILRHVPVGEYLYDSLFTYYGGQLQVLRAGRPISFPASCFMKSIQVLELSLDPSAVLHLPWVCGETLKALRLVNVPHNFTWHNFCHNLFIRPIIFRQLTSLRLAYEEEDEELTEGEIQERVDLGAQYCDQLQFPALKYLAVDKCTPDCDLLYMTLPFPELERVKLSGTAKSILHCGRLKLTWVGTLHVWVNASKSDTSTDIHRATNHLFSDICIGRTLFLGIWNESFILDPDVICWINLTKLELKRASYATVCKAIGRLPNLGELIIRYFEFGDMVTGRFYAEPSLFISSDALLAWGEKIDMVQIYVFVDACPFTVYCSGIQALILHMGALKYLYLPQSINQPVAMVINSYKDRYPHLAKIQLLD